MRIRRMRIRRMRTGSMSLVDGRATALASTPSIDCLRLGGLGDTARGG